MVKINYEFEKRRRELEKKKKKEEKRRAKLEKASLLPKVTDASLPDQAE